MLSQLMIIMYLQEDPIASLQSLLDHLLSDRTLALSQRNRSEFLGVTHIEGESLKRAERVRSGTQNEYQGHGIRSVLISRIQFKILLCLRPPW